MAGILVTYFAFIHLLSLVPVAELVSFAKSPPKTITVLKGEQVFFPWLIDLGRAKLVLYECGFFKEHIYHPIAEGKSSFHSLWINVVAYNNFTFSLQNVKYENSSEYYCKVIYELDNVGKTLSSNKTELRVEGAPEFCGAQLPTEIRKTEREDVLINVSLCALPAPTVEYRWSDSIKETVTSIPQSDSTFIHVGKINIQSIKKEKCGKTLYVIGKNSRGKTEEKNITINVDFAPAKPSIREAYFTNNTCVKCVWDKQDSGSCSIIYQIDLLNEKGDVVKSKNGTNLQNTEICSLGNNTVTSVRVNASTSFGYAVSVFVLKNGPTTTQPPPANGGNNGNKGSSIYIIVGCVIGGIILLAIVVVGLFYGKKTGCSCGKTGQEAANNGHGKDGDFGKRPDKSEYAVVDANTLGREEPCYAETRKNVLYGDLGVGGGRVGPKPSVPMESNYADVKLDEQGYPAVGPTTSNYGEALISDEAIV